MQRQKLLNWIQLNGYVYYSSKYHKASHKSGGVGAFIKLSIIEEYKVSMCTEHCIKCNELCNFSNTLHVWFRIGDILFGIVYVPPEGSKYTEHEAFESLSNIILELMEHLECPNVCLIGDFNARTGRLDDCLS